MLRRTGPPVTPMTARRRPKPPDTALIDGKPAGEKLFHAAFGKQKSISPGSNADRSFPSISHCWSGKASLPATVQLLRAHFAAVDIGTWCAIPGPGEPEMPFSSERA